MKKLERKSRKLRTQKSIKKNENALNDFIYEYKKWIIDEIEIIFFIHSSTLLQSY